MTVPVKCKSPKQRKSQAVSRVQNQSQAFPIDRKMGKARWQPRSERDLILAHTTPVYVDHIFNLKVYIRCLTRLY